MGEVEEGECSRESDGSDGREEGWSEVLFGELGGVVDSRGWWFG